MSTWCCAAGHRWDGTALTPKCPECGLPGSNPEAATLQTAAPSGWSPVSVPPPPSDPISRAEVPGFEIRRELGRGGMGVVYLARQAALDRLVALKVIRTGLWATPEQRERFAREARMVAALDHPGIVGVYAVGEHRGRPYFAMEYVEGGSLADALTARQWRIGDWKATARLMEQLARATQHAHERGVVHRDLKPANILLVFHRGSQNRDGSICDPPLNERAPKIADFGLARPHDQAGGTGSGTLLGTPLYMSPEQAAGRSREIGPATDIHALGVVLYELATGKTPFVGDTFVETLQRVRDDAPAPPSRHRPDLPPELEAICLRCLAKQPAMRYASAADLADDLAKFQAAEPTPTPRRLRPMLWLAVSAVFLIALVSWWALPRATKTQAGNGGTVETSPQEANLPATIDAGGLRVEGEAPEPVRQTTNLPRAVASLVEGLALSIEGTTRKFVVVTPVTGPGSGRAGAGELIRGPMVLGLEKAFGAKRGGVKFYPIEDIDPTPESALDALKKAGVPANRDSLLLLRGNFFVTENEGDEMEATHSQGLEVQVAAELSKPGEEDDFELIYGFTAVVGVEGNADLVKLLGMTAALRSADAKSANRELWKQWDRPAVVVNGTKVQARAESRFAVELVPKGGGPARPVTRGGQAVVRLKGKEPFTVLVHKGSEEVAVTVTVAGVNALPDADRATQPWVVLQSRRELPVSGWRQPAGLRPLQMPVGGGMVTVSVFEWVGGKTGRLREAITVRVEESAR